MNIIKLEFPLKVSDLDKGEIFYLNGYYISFSRNRGKPPCILRLGKGVWEDSSITYITDTLLDINSSFEVCVAVVNLFLNEFSEPDIDRLAMKIACDIHENNR